MYVRGNRLVETKLNAIFGDTRMTLAFVNNDQLYTFKNDRNKIFYIYSDYMLEFRPEEPNTIFYERNLEDTQYKMTILNCDQAILLERRLHSQGLISVFQAYYPETPDEELYMYFDRIYGEIRKTILLPFVIEPIIAETIDHYAFLIESSNWMSSRRKIVNAII